MAGATPPVAIRKAKAMTANTIAVCDARGGSNVTVFDPQRTRSTLARLEGDIVRARRMRDWPELEAAADAKLAEQAAFLMHWDETVRPNHRPGTVFLGGQISVAAAEAAWDISKQTVSRWRTLFKDPQAYRSRIILGACRAAGLEPSANHRAESTGDTEWFTPAEYIEAAREVMGSIDLDPASHPIAQQTVRAERFYTAADDGLAQEWHGKVWLNPPYTRELIGQFTAKLIEEYRAGRTTEAILLTHAYTDPAWFHKVWAAARFACFTCGRIAFINETGITANPTQGQAFFYFGKNADQFASTFRAFGTIALAVSDGR